MIKTEKGTSESLECIKKYQKELDEYIHSEKIKDDLGRLLGGFVPLESLITSAKFAETEYQTFLGLMKITDLAKTLKEINNTIESVLPIYERAGDSNFIDELKRKGLLENLEKIFDGDIFKKQPKFQELFLDPRLGVFNGYLAYNIKKGRVSLFWNFLMDNPLFIKNEDFIFLYQFEETSFEKDKFFRDDELGELTRVLFFSIFSEKYFKKAINILLSDFILKGYNDFVSKFLLLDPSASGDIYEENNILFSVPNCFIDENLKNSKLLYFLEKFGSFQCEEYDEFVESDFVKNLPLEKVQNLRNFAFTLCYYRGSFDGADWLKGELLRRLEIPKPGDSTWGDTPILLENLKRLSELYDDKKISNTIDEAVEDYFKNNKKINFKFEDDIESDTVPIDDVKLLKLSIDNYVKSLEGKKVGYVMGCSDRLFDVNTPFTIDEEDVFQTIGPLLRRTPKFGLRQAYRDMYKLNIFKTLGYTPTETFLFVSEYKWGSNYETIDATFYNLKNLIDNNKDLNFKIFVLEDIVRSFDPKDYNLDLELFQNETGLKEFQVVKSEEDMFDILEKDGFEEIIFE